MSKQSKNPNDVRIFRSLINTNNNKINKLLITYHENVLCNKYFLRETEYLGHILYMLYYFDMQEGDPPEFRCILGNLVELSMTGQLQKKKLKKFEEEVLSAWQSQKSVFHFLEASETLREMFDGNANHSCGNTG